MLYVCYDNGAYMNTGFQRSGATPVGAWTTTSPVGKESAGKLQHRKNLTEIMIAHGIKYVAQASPHDPRDLVRKAAKALAIDGPDVPQRPRALPARLALGRRREHRPGARGGEHLLLAAVRVRGRRVPPHLPAARTSCRWSRGSSARAASPTCSSPATRRRSRTLEAWVDEEWEKLLRKCGEPSEADWREAIESRGCMLPE